MNAHPHVYILAFGARSVMSDVGSGLLEGLSNMRGANSRRTCTTLLVGVTPLLHALTNSCFLCNVTALFLQANSLSIMGKGRE